MRIVRVIGMVGVVAAALAILSSRSPRVQAASDPSEQIFIQIGFQIAPVPLNLVGKDHDLVGLGSYLVNAIGDCNGCHNGGGPPNFNYAAGHNPYFGEHPAKVDPTTYLAGGADFGPAIPFNVGPGLAYGSYVGPDIITRNLTPDKTGRPEGGNSLGQFMSIIKTGHDPDRLHPTCTSATPSPTPANCIPPPVDGSLLQIMPWPVFQNMTDHQLQAIYEYLSAIPCIEGPSKPSDLPPPMRYAFPALHNDCH